ncbi:MAG TPA: hypothetical protein VKA67_03540, partial [Verrucomicrobiae bacterium]|nr:hypothetical protein [Verrucomicrobiae bacterium]
MKKFIHAVLIGLLFNSVAVAKTESAAPSGLTIREIRYDGKLSANEARFTIDVDAEASSETSATLLEGDVAVLPSRLPHSLR